MIMGRTRAAGTFALGRVGDIEENDPSLVLTLARGLIVLNCFNKRRTDLSNKEITVLTGLSKPTVSRITYTLAKFGFLYYSDRLHRYSLGLAVLATAHPLLSQMKIKQIARPLMQQMANEVGGAVSIGMPFGSQMIYIESCAPAESVNPVVAGVGAQIPLYRTAMGRAYLAGLPEATRKKLLDSLNPGWDLQDSPYLAHVQEALDQKRKWGFCLAIENLVKDTRSVGVPMQSQIDDQFYAFNCGVPVFRLKPNQIRDEIGPRLLTVVRDVEMALGIHEIEASRQTNK